jgi:predicted HTH transcriptional regulator
MDTVWQAEDALREKKVESDLKDLLKTMIAFANSVSPGDTAQIFIGEKDDGTVQGVRNTDNIQKSVVKEAAKIYPEIYYRTEVYERDGKQCVRVDIKHNGLGPHFGGAAWIRRGSKTVEATEELYQQLINQRQAKTRVLLQWVTKDITVHWQSKRTELRENRMYNLGYHKAALMFVGDHWVTFQISDIPNTPEFSEPLEKLLLSWDDEAKHLKVEVRE